MVLLFRPQTGVSLVSVAVGEEEYLMLTQSIWRQAMLTSMILAGSYAKNGITSLPMVARRHHRIQPIERRNSYSNALANDTHREYPAQAHPSFPAV